MKVVFRVDASGEVGFGHLSRCINLAEVLRSRGNEVSFICRDDESQSFRVLEDRLFSTVLLPSLAAGEVSNQQQDADQTVEALNGIRPDWLVVDNYGLDKQWEQIMRSHTAKIAVIEDLCSRQHDCDLLLDQNYSDRSNDAFSGQVPDACEFLLGPRFALISQEFRRIREIKTKPASELKHIFVFCGGSDPQNLTQQVIDELSIDELSNIAIDVVIGAQNKGFNREALHKLKPNFEIHEAGAEFARIMRRADLAIGAGGTTSWERMCLGVPSVVVSIAENQNPACEKLGRDDLVTYLGAQASLRPGAIRDEVLEVISSYSSVFDQIESGQILVDGRGCERVAEVMCPSSESDFVVRLARSDDCVEFFNWANDPVVREQSLTTSTIQWEDHKKWFTEKISSASCEMYVMEASGLPVGQVRFEKSGDVAEINYSLDKIVRNRRLASILLEMAIEKYRKRDAVLLKAAVRSENKRSRSVFFKLGFSENVSVTPPPSALFSFAFVSDKGSWFNSYLRELKFDLLISGHSVSHVHEEEDLSSADFCFYLSFSKVVSKDTLNLFRHNFVVHSSDLPEGKGWSPLTWQILEGKNEIPTVLFEAAKKVDSGRIYLRQKLKFEGYELIDEMRAAQGTLIVSMVKSLIEGYPGSLANGIEQSGEGSYYTKRRPVDSKIDPDYSLRQAFKQFRVADNESYPAFFELNGHKYELRISRK